MPSASWRNGGSAEQQAFSISIPCGSRSSTALLRFMEMLDFDKSVSINIQETNSMRTITNAAHAREGGGGRV
jgi:hypothetical protein